MLKKLLIASVLALPVAAMADGLSYNFLQASYVNVDGDGGGKADGFDFSGSHLVGKNIFLQGGYSRVTIDGSDIDVSAFNGGLGFRHGLTPTVDLNAGASVVFAEVDAGSFGSEDDTGYSLNAGLRALVAPQLELNGGVTYTDIFDEADTSFGIGAVFSFTPQIAVIGGAGFADDANTYSVGGRFMF